MKSLPIIIIFLLSVSSIFPQAIEEDLTVQYMKANVLFESGRFDEAVRMYNRILAINENYAEALYMRAMTKYELGAFRGTKNDVISYIEKVGVNKDIIHLMTRTEYALSNFRAAKNYIQTALELDEFDGNLYFMAGDIALATDDKSSACENYAKGAQLGHLKSQEKLNTECRGIVLSMTEAKIRVDTSHEDRTDSLEALNDNKYPDPVIFEDQNLPPVDLSAQQEIEVDSKLSINIANGLGERKVETIPNIFMLSTEDGHVVIDICLNADGKVIASQFNRDRSNIFRSSLISLAIRKAREFLFIPSLRAEQCGSLTFNIKS